MQEVASSHELRDGIKGLLVQCGLGDECFLKMLDYTVDLFETRGLGIRYYGYHNINHELEVTYISLLVASRAGGMFTTEDAKYLYAAALFHDFDPEKSVDKPHEQNVVRFIAGDEKLGEFLCSAGIDTEILKVLILRTTYPWSGRLQEDAESQIRTCFEKSGRAAGDPDYRERVMWLGRYLSVIDRMGGYSMGGFAKAMGMAKMNAHALGWKPSVIVRRSVAFFEYLLDGEAETCGRILGLLPNEMRKNFFDTVLEFMRIRQQEIAIQADFAYGHLRLIPTIETMSVRQDPEFAESLRSIFLELPKPLQFNEDTFVESVRDADTILTTLRLGPSGDVVGFTKGGPLERYKLRPEVRDENYGSKNTVFLEPLALKLGYYGLGGGSEMRHMFIMQALAKKYKNLTSFALRDVIEARIGKEDVEFVAQIDPERWDYYRIRLDSVRV